MRSHKPNPTTPPVPLRVSGALATGSILQPVNSSMIAVGIVAIAAHFGSTSGVSWVISAMYIGTAVASPMAGRLGMLLGARRVYLAGLALVAVGSVSGMLAPSIGWLVASYAVVGVGISAHLPNAMTMIRSYAERHRRQPRSAITTLMICGQSTAALGPTAGGLLVGSFGWQSLLWVNLPIAAISAVSVLLTDVGMTARSTESTEITLHSFDLIGIALFIVTITSTMLWLMSFRDTPTWVFLPAATLGFGAFVAWEWRARQPFLDIKALIANPPLGAALGRTLATYTCIYCVFFGIPQWLQYSRGMTATEAGLIMLPVAVASVISTVIGSSTYRRYGVRVTLALGTFALLLGGVLVACVERTTSPIAILLIVAAVLGIPNGINNIGNQSHINAVTSVDEVGTAIGMYRTVQFIGTNLAVVILQVAAGDKIDDAGLHRIGWLIAAVGFVLLVCIACARRTMPPSRRTAARHGVADSAQGTEDPDHAFARQAGPKSADLGADPR
ncbi:MFS transporter [Rhodococcus koreensis]